MRISHILILFSEIPSLDIFILSAVARSPLVVAKVMVFPPLADSKIARPVKSLTIVVIISSLSTFILEILYFFSPILICRYDFSLITMIEGSPSKLRVAVLSIPIRKDKRAGSNFLVERLLIVIDCIFISTFSTSLCVVSLFLLNCII